MSSAATLRVFWRHAIRYKWTMALLTFAIVALNIVELFLPVFYKRLVDVATTLPLGTALRDALIAVLLSIAALNIARWAMFRIAAFTNNRFQPRVMIDLERSAFSYLLGHSYRFFSNAFAGALVRKVHRLSRGFEMFADQIFWRFLNVITLTTGMLVLFAIRAPILAVVLAVWVALFVTVNVIYSRWKMRYDTQRAALDSEATAVLSDAIANAATIQQFNGTRFEEGTFHGITERLRRIYTFTWNLGEMNDAIQFAFMVLLEIVAMYIVINGYAAGVLTIGDFILIHVALAQLFDRLWDFGRVIRHVYESIADAQEMVDIFEMPYELVDAPHAQALAVHSGAINFNAVSFGYTAQHEILRDFTLSVAAHEKIAFIGPSGAGKSTIIKVLLRLFDVTDGSIEIDGQNIAMVTQESLRDAIALVPQDPALFHRSLMENIRYGRRDASNAEVIEAAKQAHCDEFISHLPNGYDTMVGERGIKLSGGERQRVAIARAILKNAPILVLDEATSSLDSESESLIQSALKVLMVGKTVVVIAHRLSTIMLMDRIVVIEQGGVADMGTHEELLKRKGTYAKLWNIQAGGFLR